MEPGYILDNAQVQERERLRLRESVHDPETRRHLALGVPVLPAPTHAHCGRERDVADGFL
jgi:hypothetical protein